MPVSLIRKDYLLSEAFELIGQRLFGADWNGNELTAFAVPSPEQMQADREPLLAALQAIESELLGVGGEIERTTNEAKMGEFTRRRESLFERRIEIANQLLSRPEPSDTNRWLYGNFQRKQRVESTLLDALRHGQIKAHDGRNCPIDNLLWRGHPHFGFSIELSVVRMPRNLSSKRFQPARISEPEFDEWLLTLAPLTASAEQSLPPIEQCRRLIHRWANSNGGMQERSKEEYRAEAMAMIPKLTKRAFESAWAQAAPNDWKRLGRRRWPKNPPKKP